jgi:hypothetical protein
MLKLDAFLQWKRRRRRGTVISCGLAMSDSITERAIVWYNEKEAVFANEACPTKALKKGTNWSASLW